MHWGNNTAGDHIRIWYIDSENAIHQINWDWDGGSGWSDSVTSARTYPGSSLAAQMDSEEDVAYSVYYTNTQGQLSSFGWANADNVWRKLMYKSTVDPCGTNVDLPARTLSIVDKGVVAPYNETANLAMCTLPQSLNHTLYEKRTYRIGQYNQPIEIHWTDGDANFTAETFSKWPVADDGARNGIAAVTWKANEQANVQVRLYYPSGGYIRE